MNVSRNLATLALLIWALGLTACAGSGGGGGGAAAPGSTTSGAIGTTPGFNSSQPSAKQYSLGYPTCQDANGKITSNGLLVQQTMYPGCSTIVTEKFLLNSNGTFTRSWQLVGCGATLTGTITGSIAFNSTTRKATLTNMVSNTSSSGHIDFPFSISPSVGSAFSSTDQTVSLDPNNTALPNQTVDYINFPNYAGFGLKASFTTPNDASSACFLYYN